MTMIERAAAALANEMIRQIKDNDPDSSAAVRVVIESLREETMVILDPRDGGMIHELRGAPDDIWKMCIDAALNEGN